MVTVRRQSAANFWRGTTKAPLALQRPIEHAQPNMEEAQANVLQETVKVSMTSVLGTQNPLEKCISWQLYSEAQQSVLKVPRLW